MNPQIGDIVCCADERRFGLVIGLIRVGQKSQRYLYYDYTTHKIKKILRFAIGAKVKYESKSKT